MRVLQVGRRLDLGQETLGTDDRSEFRLQHLERDLPLVPEIVGQVDRRHPALAELELDAIAPFEGSVEAGDRAWGVQALTCAIDPAYRE